jgi:hypothetical protein
MENPYRPEHAETEVARQEAIRQQELERRLVQAEPAESGKVTAAKTEGEAMRSQLHDQPVAPEVAAGQRLEVAEPVRLRDTPKPGQMTDTPLHCQGDQPDCLLQSVRMAEHQQTGVDPGLEAYKTPAIEKGIYDPDSGTDMNGMAGIINERPGVEAQLKSMQQPEDIKRTLDNHESVIAGVDAYEFYKDQMPYMEDSGAGHAIVVTSAEKLPNGDWKFTVNDPNFETPNQLVAGDKFLNAWDKKGSPMLVIQKR